MLNRLFPLWGRCGFAIISLCVLAGCLPTIPKHPVVITGTPTPFPCVHFEDAHWKEFRFGVDTQNDVIAAAGRIWGIGHDDVQILDPGPTYPLSRVAWDVEASGINYAAAFYQEGALKRIYFSIGFSPTLDQVIGCFGPPDFYAAYKKQDLETAEINLEIWYANSGLVFLHNSYSGHHRRPIPPPFPHELSMLLIYIVPQGNVAKMVEVIYGTGSPGREEFVLCVLRPWPGSIEAIEIEKTDWHYTLPSECFEPLNG